ncbi:hypothetical protein HMPREF1548_00563 [Clostridium sp. KLE 1755]|nr:hypothetical protein HMPREF1548_00563 [Clostridium sp. KLE 1755]
MGKGMLDLSCHDLLLSAAQHLTHLCFVCFTGITGRSIKKVYKCRENTFTYFS